MYTSLAKVAYKVLGNKELNRKYHLGVIVITFPFTLTQTNHYHKTFFQLHVRKLKITISVYGNYHSGLTLSIK